MITRKPLEYYLLLRLLSFHLSEAHSGNLNSSLCSFNFEIAESCMTILLFSKTTRSPVYSAMDSMKSKAESSFNFLRKKPTVSG